MTIECYDDKCPKHAIHYDPDGGPFCDEEECVKLKFCYDDPEHGKVTKTSQEILDEFYPIWYDRMLGKYGKEEMESRFYWVCHYQCIQDWCVVNGAWEVFE